MPGSTYRAAELHEGIDEANQVAELLDLEFRFETAMTPSEQEASHE